MIKRFKIILALFFVLFFLFSPVSMAENKKEFGEELESAGIAEEGPAEPIEKKDLEKEENVGIRPVGAPIFTYSSDFGPSFGAHLAIYNYGDASVQPFKYLYRLQGLFGTNGDMNNYFFFDAPKIFGSAFRFQTRIGYQVIHNYNYFGIGNGTSNDQPESFYRFKRTTPGILINVIRDIKGNFKLIFGYLFEQRITDEGTNSKLAQDKPRGYNGGKDSELRVGLAYDSRDTEGMTSKGNFIDLYAEVPIKAFGSSYNYARFTFADRNYVKLFDPLVWANRILLKTSVGDVPFYEMAKIGGYAHFDGIGGNSTLRGYKQARFIDRSVILFNEELRLKIMKFYMFKQRFELYTVAFADFGRVFSSLENFSLNHMHLSGGGGIRVCWNKTFVLAPDVGFSNEGYSIYFGFNNMF